MSESFATEEAYDFPEDYESKEVNNVSNEHTSAISNKNTFINGFITSIRKIMDLANNIKKVASGDVNSMSDEEKCNYENFTDELNQGGDFWKMIDPYLDILSGLILSAKELFEKYNLQNINTYKVVIEYAKSVLEETSLDSINVNTGYITLRDPLIRHEIMEKLNTLEHNSLLDGENHAIDANLLEGLPTVYYHGNRQYSINQQDLIIVTEKQHKLLEFFLKNKRPPNKSERKVLGNISQLFKQLKDRQNGVFSKCIKPPGKKGAGSYYIKVQEVIRGK